MGNVGFTFLFFPISTKQERDLESGKNPKPGEQKRARHFQNPMRRIRKETCEREKKRGKEAKNGNLGEKVAGKPKNGEGRDMVCNRNREI